MAGSFLFALAAVALGIGTVVALVSLSRAMRAEVGDELDRFGANLIVTPAERLLCDPRSVRSARADRIVHVQDERVVHGVPDAVSLTA